MANYQHFPVAFILFRKFISFIADTVILCNILYLIRFKLFSVHILVLRIISHMFPSKLIKSANVDEGSIQPNEVPNGTIKV